MRMIVDLARPGRAAVVNPPGQVGHPLSRHYRDQVDLWLNGLTIPLDTDTMKVVRSDYDLLWLVPESNLPAP
jgi:acyl-homoserine lactone acylase PvdQ